MLSGCVLVWGRSKPLAWRAVFLDPAGSLPAVASSFSRVQLFSVAPAMGFWGLPSPVRLDLRTASPLAWSSFYTGLPPEISPRKANRLKVSQMPLCDPVQDPQPHQVSVRPLPALSSDPC